MVHTPGQTLSPSRTRAGFTLLELLVVLAIIALLAVLVLPAAQNGIRRGRMVREIASARTLMQGMMNYVVEHDGRILPGYHNEPVKGPDGTPLMYPASARYPWRLLPYIGGGARSVMWADPRGGTKSILDSASEEYAISLSPSLGMNIFYVGGDDSGVSGQGIRAAPRNVDRFGHFYLSRLGQSSAPSRQLVFASARMPDDGGGRPIPGYYMVQAPKVMTPTWSKAPWSAARPPAEHGYVDFRYKGEAVVAFLDASVRLMNEQDLRDMRYWSNQAAHADDPDWHLR